MSSPDACLASNDFSFFWQAPDESIRERFVCRGLLREIVGLEAGSGLGFTSC